MPGTVAALGIAHARYGKQAVGGSARARAAPGEGRHARQPPHGDHHRQLAKELANYPETACVFLPGGKPPREGDLLKQTEFATTIARLQKLGWKEFYQGELARQIVAGLRARQPHHPGRLGELRGAPAAAVARNLSPVPGDDHAARDLRGCGAAGDAEHPRTVRTRPRQSRVPIHGT